MWVMARFDELIDMRHWPKRVRWSRVMALASRETSERLRGSLAVEDAKSLYDQVCKDAIGGSGSH